MVTYHINDHGDTRQCSTTPDRCQFNRETDGHGVMHYSDYTDALQAAEQYAQTSATPPLTKQSSRYPHGIYTPFTIDDAHALVRHYNLPPVVGCGLYGSFAENLDKPSSDRDCVVIVEGLNKQRPRQYAYGGDDVVIVPAERYTNAVHNYLTVHCGTLELDPSSPYASYIHSARPDLYTACDGFRGSMIVKFQQSEKQTDVERRIKFAERSMKDFERSRRVAYAIAHGEPYTARFSDAERNRYFDELTTLTNLYHRDPNRAAAKLWEKLERSDREIVTLSDD